MRAWGFLVWFFAALFALGYCLAVARQGDAWLKQMASTNVKMGMVVALLTVLVNTPVLDFRKLSAASQVARLEAGDVDVQEFDFRYLKFELGRPGYLALERIKTGLP